MEGCDESKDIDKPEQLSVVQEPNHQPNMVSLSLVNPRLRKKDYPHFDGYRFMGLNQKIDISNPARNVNYIMEHKPMHLPIS